MRFVRFAFGSLTAASVLLAPFADASEPLVSGKLLASSSALKLSVPEVQQMLGSGAQVEVVGTALGTVRTWTNEPDGTLVATVQGLRGPVGRGTWRLTDQGEYCVTIAWTNQDEKWCRTLYRYDGALYLAPPSLGSALTRSFGRVTLLVSKAPSAGQLPMATAPATGSLPVLPHSKEALVEPKLQSAQIDPSRPPAKIQMVYFGGNDCPPCVAWRGTELPKLEKTDVFKSIDYIYVTKSIFSPVPSAAFLPDEVKPYKALLDLASAGNRGSSQTAIMVDGRVFDYYWGARDASDIERRLNAIRNGGVYPFPRCVRVSKSNSMDALQCLDDGTGSITAAGKT